MNDSDLAPPAVESTEYDSSYYLHSCIGSDEWRESEGKDAAGIYPGALKLAGLADGDRLLDIGTGRGDILPVAIRMGASRAVGVDYSEAAVELGQQTLAAADDVQGAEVLLADARRLPAEDEDFDVVTMLDVVEHLTDEELSVSLGEARRALKPGGRVFVHTAPNRLVYTVAYRAQRRMRPGRAARWPEDPRNDFERRMHVNEQSPLSLRKTLKDAGFVSVKVRLGGWVYTDFVPDPPSERPYRVFSRVPVLRWLTTFDLFAFAEKPND